MERTVRYAAVLSRLMLCTVVMAALSACGSKLNRYALVEESLLAGDSQQADRIVERAEPEYGSENRVLYDMDRGMTLHLAGYYQASNGFLEQAEQEVERLYTRRLRTEAKAFLINDAKLMYEGEPYEHTMINIIKGLNYAVSGNWSEALVEARRLDHRLNVLADTANAKDGYRDDAFARYLCGVFYETTGDLNNAFIAYRKAEEAYRAARPWSHTPVPPQLQADLLRMAHALHLNEDVEAYRREFGEIAWRPSVETQPLAQVVVISYNGRAPRKEDRIIDVPISMDALKLVLLTKLPPHPHSRDRRTVESVLYGLNGRIIRIAIPILIPQKTQVRYAQVTASDDDDSYHARTELVQNLTAVAEKSLSDRLTGISVKAVARAVVKYALADGAWLGDRAAVGKDEAGQLIGMLVGGLAHVLAIASEEADKRSWRTLPDEIQIARLWLPPGEYRLQIQPVKRDGSAIGQTVTRTMILRGGETKLVTERVLP
ncbi:MAG: hypothetical protein ICV76_03375 [Nitrospiraceae bacterium]|nr:hypothetical protein [Nitrospiraceae bacterium]